MAIAPTASPYPSYSSTTLAPSRCKVRVGSGRRSYAILTHVTNSDFIQKRIQIFPRNRTSQSNGNGVNRHWKQGSAVRKTTLERGGGTRSPGAQAHSAPCGASPSSLTPPTHPRQTHHVPSTAGRPRRSGAALEDTEPTRRRRRRQHVPPELAACAAAPRGLALRLRRSGQTFASLPYRGPRKPVVPPFGYQRHQHQPSRKATLGVPRSGPAQRLTLCRRRRSGRMLQCSTCANARLLERCNLVVSWHPKLLGLEKSHGQRQNSAPCQGHLLPRSLPSKARPERAADARRFGSLFRGGNHAGLLPGLQPETAADPHGGDRARPPGCSLPVWTYGFTTALLSRFEIHLEKTCIS